MNIILKIQIFWLPLFLSITASAQYSFNWAHTYGGDDQDRALTLVESKDGGIFLGGYAQREEKKLWIIKVHPDGISWWGKTYKAREYSEARSILAMPDTGLLAVGYYVKKYDVQSDLWILRLDKDGQEIWEQSHGGFGDEEGNKVIQSIDGGFVIAGSTTTNLDLQMDGWLIKTDSLGNKLWERTYGGEKAEELTGVAENDAGELYLSGYTSSKGQGLRSFWAMKLDEKGTLLWEEIYRINIWDEASDVIATQDGGAVFIGYTRTHSVVDRDLVIIKVKTDGTIEWQETVNWGRWDEATSVYQTFDLGIVVAGFTKSGEMLNSNFGVVKFSKDGIKLWEHVFYRKSMDHAQGIIETRDDGLAIVGSTYTTGQGWDYALLKYKNDNEAVISFSQDSISTSILENYEIGVCIKTKAVLKNLQLFFNDSLIVDNEPLGNIAATAACDIGIKKGLVLKKGFNSIRIEITDHKDFTKKKECKIYYMPPNEVSY